MGPCPRRWAVEGPPHFRIEITHCVGMSYLIFPFAFLPPLQTLYFVYFAQFLTTTYSPTVTVSAYVRLSGHPLYVTVATSQVTCPEVTSAIPEQTTLRPRGTQHFLPPTPSSSSLFASNALGTYNSLANIHSFVTHPTKDQSLLPAVPRSAPCLAKRPHLRYITGSCLARNKEHRDHIVRNYQN